MNCPKCESSNVEKNPTEGGLGIGAQIGSIVLGCLALPLGAFATFIALNAGAAAGGAIGWKLTERNECQECGHRWG